MIKWLDRPISHNLTFLQGLEPYCRITDTPPGVSVLASRPPVGNTQPARIHRNVILPSESFFFLRWRGKCIMHTQGSRSFPGYVGLSPTKNPSISPYRLDGNRRHSTTSIQQFCVWAPVSHFFRHLSPQNLRASASKHLQCLTIISGRITVILL